MAAGSIVIDLLMKTGMFETDTKRAEKALQNFTKQAKQVGAAVGVAMAAAGTAVAIWTKQTIEAAAQVDRLSQLANTSSDTFQRWAAGANMVGIEQDKLADILKDTQDKVGDFIQTGGGAMADFFEQIAPRVGVTAEQFRKLSGPDALQLYVSSLQKANLSQSDMIFYMEAIASDSSLLLPLLKDNAAAMDEYGDMAERLGAVMSGDMIDSAALAREEFKKLDLVKQGLINRIVEGVLPSLTNMTGKLVETAEKTKALDTVARIAVTGMKLLTSAGIIVGGIFKTVGEALGGVAAVIVQLFEGNFAQAWETAKAFSADVVGNVKGTMSAVQAVWDETDIKGTPLADATATDTKLAQRIVQDNGKKVVSEAEKIYKRVEDVIARIRRDIATFGMTPEQVQLFDLQEMGATPGQLAEAGSLLDTRRLKKEEQEEYERRQKLESDMAARYRETMESIADQRELVQLSADDQEIWNNRKWAGVEADSALGEAIVETTRKLQAEREAMADQIEVMDGIRDSTRGFLGDLRAGVGVFDALTSAIDRLNDRLWDLALDGILDSLFGKKGDPAGGSAGGGLWDMIGGLFFGGAKAGGGDVLPSRGYWVGEDGPEWFSPRTAGTILPAAASTALAGGGGRPLNITQQFINPVMADRRSDSQRAAEAAKRQRMAARNA